MRFTTTILFFLATFTCFSQNFTFTERGHTYNVTASNWSTTNLTWGGHGLYHPSAILPSSLTNNQYVLLFTANVNAFPTTWPHPQAIFMQTSTDGHTWSAPLNILNRPGNLCDIATAKVVYDTAASKWRVFTQGVTYVNATTCSGDNMLFEATGTLLTGLAWFGGQSNATSISGNLGNTGFSEDHQWFNTANYNGLVSAPLMFLYHVWNWTGVDPNYCPSCTNNGTPFFNYLTANPEQATYFWYYTSPAYAGGPGLLYPDVLLGGTAEESTLGPPGFSVSQDCSTNPQKQFGSGIGFYPTPAPYSTGSPSLPGQFKTGSFNVPGDRIFMPRFARNPFGYLDKISSSPNTWETLIFYNNANEYFGTKCGIPDIGATMQNNGSSGRPLSGWAATKITITEQ